MMKKSTTILMCFVTFSLFAQQDLYWVNKFGGNFGDEANWSQNSGGSGGEGIPNANTNVIFDDNSGLEIGDIVTFEAGEGYEVNSFVIEENLETFTLDFDGVSGNNTSLTIYDDLIILTPVVTTFAEESAFLNQIIIDGNGAKHNIITSGINLNSFEFKDPDGEYKQGTDLYAKSRIRMYGGEWSTQGFEVRTDGTLLIDDNQSTTNQYTKVFKTDNSDIYCEEYNARFVYGSLNVIGGHTIFTEKFTGNPSQNNLTTQYDHIELLDYEPGFVMPIEDNNLDCVGCVVQTVTISDVDVTRIGGDIEIHTLNIQNRDNIIQINGGNSRENFIKLDVVNTPSIGSCNTMPTIESVYTPVGEIEAINSSLTLSRLKLNNVNAGNTGSYNLSSGLLFGSSTGWNLINPIPPNEFYWTNNGGDQLWTNYKNWDNLQGAKCIPTQNDNVYIDNSSPSDIIVPTNEDVFCRDFNWIKDDGEINLLLNENLVVTGDFLARKWASFSGTGSIHFRGTGQFGITSSVELPPVRFESKGSDYTLQNELKCESLFFDGVNFHTDGYPVTTNDWGVANVNGNNFYFGNSTITVNGDFDLAANNGVDQILDAGTSTIICQDFQSRKSYDFHNLELLNPSTFSLENWPFSFNKLEINGSGKVMILGDLEVNDLILLDGNSELELAAGVELTVNNEVESFASSSSPATLRSVSSSNPATIIKPNGNFCVDGHIDIENITGVAEGVLHAPEGNNIGGNSGFDFTPYNTNQSIPLYWIGRTNENFAIRSNWSTVSGGCSTNYDPQNRPSLIFDQHSYYEDNQMVIYTSLTTNKLKFNNVADEFIVDNRVQLTFDELELISSYVRFIGGDFNISQSVEASEGSVMDIRADMISPSWIFFTSGFNNLIVVRDNAQLIETE